MNKQKHTKRNSNNMNKDVARDAGRKTVVTGDIVILTRDVLANDLVTRFQKGTRCKFLGASSLKPGQALLEVVNPNRSDSFQAPLDSFQPEGRLMLQDDGKREYRCSSVSCGYDGDKTCQNCGYDNHERY
jgi:hypothetical protein